MFFELKGLVTRNCSTTEEVYIEDTARRWVRCGGSREAGKGHRRGMAWGGTRRLHTLRVPRALPLAAVIKRELTIAGARRHPQAEPRVTIEVTQAHTRESWRARQFHQRR